MFCKYCGMDIPENAEFCPECGKQLKKEENKEKEVHKSVSAPLALMLILLCGNTVFYWGKVLLFGDRVTVGQLISTVMLAAGLVRLGTLIRREQIDTENYRFSDLLPLCCVWLVVPLLMLYWESYVVYNCGQYAYSAWFTWNNGAIPLFQFPAFWLALGFAALGLARSGNWKPTPKQKIILPAALLLRSALIFLFARTAVVGMNAPVEVLTMTVSMTRQWALLCWLWPLAILKVFRALGEGRIGSVGATVAFLGIAVGECLLLPLLVFWLGLGVNGVGPSVGLAPLFSLLILRIAARLHKKKV